MKPTAIVLLILVTVVIVGHAVLAQAPRRHQVHHQHPPQRARHDAFNSCHYWGILKIVDPVFT